MFPLKNLARKGLMHYDLKKVVPILLTAFRMQAFFNEDCCILFQISLKCVVKGSIINNRPARVQMMVWCQTGEKPLSETMVS